MDWMSDGRTYIRELDKLFMHRQCHRVHEERHGSCQARQPSKVAVRRGCLCPWFVDVETEMFGGLEHDESRTKLGMRRDLSKVYAPEVQEAQMRQVWSKFERDQRYPSLIVPGSSTCTIREATRSRSMGVVRRAFATIVRLDRERTMTVG